MHNKTRRVEGFDSPQRSNTLKPLIMIEQKIDMMLDNCGIDEDDRSEVYGTEFLTGTYYNFKIFDPCSEEMFALGNALGAEFGTEVWIDTYQKTNKYRAVAKIEVLVKNK